MSIWQPKKSNCTNITQVNNTRYLVKARISIVIVIANKNLFFLEKSLNFYRKRKAWWYLTQIHSKWNVQLYFQQQNEWKTKGKSYAKSIKRLPDIEELMHFRIIFFLFKLKNRLAAVEIKVKTKKNGEKNRFWISVNIWKKRYVSNLPVAEK